MKHGLKYYESLQKVLDGRATKKSSTLLRRAMIAHRDKQNYQLKYDRIGDLVRSKTIRGDTKEMLENRIKKLEELGAKAKYYCKLIVLKFLYIYNVYIYT